MSTRTVKLGTRSSPLALAQAAMARDAIQAAATEAIDVQIVHVTTQGDKDLRPLQEIGQRGLFASELERALLDGTIDVAVHSYKDLPLEATAGLAIVACLEREDPRDVLCATTATSLDDLPHGATVATGSARRVALLANLRDDIVILPIRGNVQTRLQRAREAGADATLLAAAGLLRLGLADEINAFLSCKSFVPEPAQGTIALQTAADCNLPVDWTKVDHPASTRRAEIERRIALQIGGGCMSPMGVHLGKRGTLHLFASHTDGSGAVWHSLEGLADVPLDAAVEQAVGFAREAGILQIVEHSRA
jgi:hydroxymethylbilane synthase